MLLLSVTPAHAVIERLPALDGTAPVEAAVAFHDLPGLALLESARPGRTGRWSFLAADPLAIIEGSTPGQDPFAAARAALARLAADPPGMTAAVPAPGEPIPGPAALPPFTGGLVRTDPIKGTRPRGTGRELIETLEPVRRGPYCGAAAWFDAGGAMGSSILIRTLVADGRRLTFHVGGGITWRSDADAEWEETRAKASGPLRALGIRVEGDEEP